jgi:hypothetical protein
MLSNALFTNSPSTPLLNKLTEQVTPAETVDEILDALHKRSGRGAWPCSARYFTPRLYLRRRTRRSRLMQCCSSYRPCSTPNAAPARAAALSIWRTRRSGPGHQPSLVPWAIRHLLLISSTYMHGPATPACHLRKPVALRSPIDAHTINPMLVFTTLSLGALSHESSYQPSFTLFANVFHSGRNFMATPLMQ